MTAKEKQLKMLEALDLRVGDVVEIKMILGTEICKISINPVSDTIRLSSVKYLCSNPPLYDISCLLNCDFEVVEYHQKTWGEYKCKDVKCSECPLNILNCNMDRLGTQTLYECLNTTIRNYDSRIYKDCCDLLDEVRDEK